jgi:TRAP-type C4-dicarboxylate transport system permease small subunit
LAIGISVHNLYPKIKFFTRIVFIAATLGTTAFATVFIIAGWSVSKQNINLTMMIDFVPAWSYNIVIAGFSLFLVAIIVNGVALVFTFVNNSMYLS